MGFGGKRRARPAMATFAGCFGTPFRRGLLAIALSASALALPSQASAFTTELLDPTAVANRSIGKLFMTKANAVTQCTAAVVDAPNQSTLITAGHCLNSAGQGAAISARFVPGYHDGLAPFGEWTASQMLASPHWDTVNHRYDYGFIVAARNARGVAVEDAVGALPIAFNQPRQQSYRLFGIPSAPNPPYDSQKLWACDTAWASDSTTDSGPGPFRLQVGCDFGEGSSGGPWLSGQGAVASVNSTSPVGQPNIENGPYLDSDAAALFATAGNIPTGPPARSKKKCKKKKKGRSAASAKKKKCKRKHRRH